MVGLVGKTLSALAARFAPTSAADTIIEGTAQRIARGDLAPIDATVAPATPLTEDDLRSDLAGPQIMSTRSIVSNHPSQGLAPQRLARLLVDAEQGDMTAYLELAEDIEEKEWQYGSVLGTRKRAVSQEPIEVDAASDSPDDKADADFIRTWLERDTLESELADILDGIGKGFSVTEIIWELTPEAWLPARLEWRDPRWFRFDPIDGQTLRLWSADGFEALKPFKYIQHVHKAKSGLPIRGGLARPAAWAWMFKNFALKEWLSFLEVFGMPLRVGRYDNGESEENIRLLMSAIAQIGSDAAAVFPKTMDVEFIDGKQKGAGGDAGALFKSMAEYIDQQISKLVVGQTGTTDAIAGGHAVGKVHNEVRGDIKRADAKLLAATLNRDLVVPMILLNRGPRKAYPRIRIGAPDPVDVAGLASAAQILVPLGLKVGAVKLRTMTGLPAPDAGEEVLKPLTPQAAKEPPPQLDGPDDAETAATALLGPLKSRLEALRAATAAADTAPATATADAIDDTVDEALADWMPVMKPVIDPIEALLASAGSLQDVRAGLATAIGTMDVEALALLLAKGSFGARIAGLVEPLGT